MADIFRADRVGSLLRPPEVHEARAAYQAGGLNADELRAVENRAILPTNSLVGCSSVELNLHRPIYRAYVGAK